MAIRIDCPRCKHPLAVPNKMAGSYARCPRCGGRFFVPKDAPTDGVADPPDGRRGGEVAAPPVAAPLAAPPPFAVPRPAVPPTLGTMASPPPPPRVASDAAKAYVSAAPPAPLAAAPPAPPAPPVVAPLRGGRKVARMITTDAVESALKPAADGQLPQLQLDEGEHRKADARPRSVHPAILYSVLLLSVLLSLWQILDMGTAPESSDPAKATKARQDIEENFFGGGNLDRGDLRAYQLLLRDAAQAYHRGDRKTERARYVKVLEMLHREHDQSLTGGRDPELENDIKAILNERS
jgi:hypothetical protein